jgi:hypothetical protein
MGLTVTEILKDAVSGTATEKKVYAKVLRGEVGQVKPAEETLIQVAQILAAGIGNSTKEAKEVLSEFLLARICTDLEKGKDVSADVALFLSLQSQAVKKSKKSSASNPS